MSLFMRNRNVVITGASDGIGKAIACLFAANGANTWLIGRNQRKLQELEKELAVFNTNIQISALNLCDWNDLMRVTASINEHWNSVDILVNNAGVADFKSLESIGLQDYDQHFDLNVRAPLFLTKQLLPSLRISRGNVVNISSYFSDRMLPNTPSALYSATKGALNSITKALALELGPHVRVNAIAPGSIHTKMVEKNLSEMSPQKRKAFDVHIKTNYPMKTMGQAQYIAEMVLFLASEKACWITGGIFPVDGGLTTT